MEGKLEIGNIRKNKSHKSQEQESSVFPDVVNVEADGSSEDITENLIGLFTKEDNIQKAARKIRYLESNKRI